MEPSDQQSGVIDALRDIQRTQSLLLDAVESLSGKPVADVQDAEAATSTAATGPDVFDPESGSERNVTGSTVADNSIEAVVTQQAAPSSSVTSSGQRAGYTSRIILTWDSLLPVSQVYIIWPDFTNTEPTSEIGPFPQWEGRKKIVAMDPWGHLAPWIFKDIMGQDNELEESVKAGRLIPDGKVCLNEFGELAVTKFAVEPCNGSDVFGSDICTCRPYLIFGIEEAVKEAQNGGSGVVIYFRKEGRALGEVTKRTENIAGVKDMRFQALMPDILHWLGIKKIDRMLSMSNMKHDAIVGQGIPIHERVELPEELIPADSRVEIDAKITAGKRMTAEELQAVQGRIWEE
ncbi:hypothetical protein G7Z17_g9542 [Cylindrodendrum hubeiense]|uniref:GTP cyclohydrolase N-terminal domain-containing protein n=1 Tax=Cylindrodendrum hubeiense TaxID=595255 RepID=A0A9P5H4D3_9HYPO|nr:hypothetical protein G7Z17_g9542 [Cylindrodendrum hubeiense]